MLKHVVLAGLEPSVRPPPMRKPTPRLRPRPRRPRGGLDWRGCQQADRRNVKNAQDETIGEIESVYVNKDGKIDSVIVGVRGSLGMGERDVKLAWKDLNVTKGGKKVTVNMTKDQLKAMAPYKYSDTKWRGHVFNDSGLYTPTGNRRPRQFRGRRRQTGWRRPRPGRRATSTPAARWPAAP